MTSCLPLTAIAVAVACLPAFSETNAALVRFRSRVVVTGRIVTLGNIAEVTDRDPAVIARLQAVPLSPAPAAGRERRISYETVRSRLSAVGINLANVEFAGNSVVTVSVTQARQKSIKRVSRVVERVPAWKVKRAEQLLTKAISRYITRRAPQTGSVTVAIRLAPRDVARVLDGWTYGFELQGGTGDLTGTQVFSLRVMDRHSRIQEMVVRCVVTPVPRIVVARYTLPSGHVIQPADLTWRQADAGASGFTRMEAVINKETRKPIRQGARILAEDIRAVPLIRSNEIVTVRSRVGGIVVTNRMKSRSAGTLGETVTLVTLDGRRRVQARVSGYHEAEVLGVGDTAGAHPAETAGRVRFQRPPTRAQLSRSGISRPAGWNGLSPGRTDSGIQRVSTHAVVTERPRHRSMRPFRSNLPRVPKVPETEGVSEWRSLDTRSVVGRTARAANGKSDGRIKPAR